MPVTDLEQQGINVIRALAMDAVQRANSGHPGTPMALAPLAHVLFTRVMRYDASQPEWPDRDRFVLSNGHASMLLYSFLYLTGFGLELDDLREFRQWESRTPGHPEYRHDPGIEVTTGPLGQGFANSVGIALAEANLRGRFGPEVSDHHTFVIAGDGDFEEGAERFERQSWLRLPSGSVLEAAAGPAGCTVWVKTGHLRHVRAAPTAPPV